MMASTRLSWIYVLLALLGVVVALPEPGKLQLTKQSRYVFLLHSFIHSRFLSSYSVGDANTLFLCHGE